jgi:hypothetical protein
MIEAQSQNTISISVDWFLQALVSSVNEESAIIPITLSVGGLLISGEMIGGKAYFNEFARQFKDGFGDISSKTAATIEEAFKRLSDMYDPTQKESRGMLTSQNLTLFILEMSKCITPAVPLSGVNYFFRP